MMRRRVLAGTAALLVGATAAAQNADRPRRVTHLRWDAPGGGLDTALREGLRELGWVDGRNVSIDVRFAEGDPQRAARLLEELLRDAPDVIVAASTPSVRAAIAATRTVPIVMAPAADPILNGFIGNLARPGGNVTGVTIGGPDLVAKQLELLREAVPGLVRVAFLGAGRDPAAPFFAERAAEAAAELGLSLATHLVDDQARLPATLDAIARSGARAMIVQPLFVFQREVVAEAALRLRLPAISELRPLAQAGLLMTYGTSSDTAGRAAAGYVDRILRGAKPGDLPVERPSRIELVVNLGTARALGLSLPSVLLQRADEVIE